ncbi:CvpA family protein [Campylobacter sp. VicNov18]|uniref:CvpA family protein n=1 Tax=Campylobacter bilis TaxID=2691918 RepID=UPI00130EFE00|nr:CvpA family protein [Campylobacter bilis]MPV63342.1 CvpA family protein [Campylobacter hepaticus]MBM0636841.1 CvpA family protein [Campylobacter bilis]MCC8277412.1 CvpA family protein [Campylobacter bilis]MCC8299155.1 CvpA family protein [Campylobacter bilis]MCC8300321.1 CvpA family protein [Campylobacter bilis]
MNFYWFDAFILGFTLLLGLKGIINGLIKEIFGLLGIIGGVFLASKYASQASEFIQNTFYRIENQSLAEFAGFLTVLIIFWIACLLFGNFLSKLIKLSGLGFLNHIGGFVFGGMKIFLIFAILIFCIAKIDFLNDKLNYFAEDSYTLNLLKRTGSFIMNQPLAEDSLEYATQKFQNITNDLNKKKD